MKKMILFIAAAVMLLSCSHQPAETTYIDFTNKGDTIIIPDESRLKDKIKVIKVGEEDYQQTLTTDGFVKAIPNQYAEIAPPYSGRISKVHLQLGQRTSPGTVLFELISPEFTDAQKLFFQARSEYQYAGIALKRQRDLLQHGVGAERDMEEAKVNYDIKEKEYQNTKEALQVFGVNVDKLRLGQSLVVTSPISGEVIWHDVVSGHYLKSDDPAHVKIAELDKVWIVGMIKEKDIQHIRINGEVQVRSAALPDRIIKGKVYHINEAVEEDARSIQVLIECENKDHALKPGMFITAEFKSESRKTIFIPSTSLLQFNEQSYVFVRVGDHKYIKKTVKTGDTDQDKIHILYGLTTQDYIISEGAFYLLDAK